MTQQRMNREEFYDRAARLDEDALRKALWTLYWRGTAAMRERIEAQLDPAQEARKRRQAQAAPDPARVLREVQHFVDLARRGAYLAGDRRVSPTERSRWRMTFRQHATNAQDALRHDDVATAAAALELMIDLACETRETDMFRSQDPLQAAGFVVSEMAAALWTRVRDRYGFQAFADRAAPQLIRWEAGHGWTRVGFGSVAERETTLAQVLGGLLQVPDHWETFTASYLAALDAAADGDEAATKKQWRSAGSIRRDRADSLTDWHDALVGHLQEAEAQQLRERLTTHRALAGRRS